MLFRSVLSEAGTTACETDLNHPQYVKDKVVNHLLPIAKKLNLDLEAFGKTYTSSKTSGAGGLLTAVGNSCVVVHAMT